MAMRAPARALGNPPPRAAESEHLSGLGNRFVEILARKLPRQDFAVEIALLIAAALRVQSVAVLGWDARRERLHLLGECGLSDGGRAALGNGGDCPWDIPVRGLRNRRISVIAAAHQNPFVPRALVSMSQGGLSIASLPIYDEREPIGVLLLLATGNRGFSDVQLQTISQALRVCARGLQGPANAAARAGAVARDNANLAAAIAELAGEGASKTAAAPPPAAQVANDERLQVSEAQLAQIREELERTAAKLRSATVASNALTRERDHLTQRVAELEGERQSVGAELRAELEAIQERLLAIESERARSQRIAEDRHTRSQNTIKALGEERDGLLERVQGSESKITVLDGALATVKGERTRLSAQVENLTGQLRATHEALERGQTRHTDERTAIESDREGWKEQAATLRSQLTQRTEELGALDRELRGTTVARDGATAQLQAARAELERLTTLNEETERALSSAEAARAAAEGETASLRRGRDRDRAEQSTLEEQLRAELSARQADADRLTAELDAAHSESAAQARTLAARDEQLAHARVELNRAQDADTNWRQAETAQRAEIATLTATVEQLTAARRQLVDERATLRTAAADLRQRATEADVLHAAAMGELQSTQAQLRRQVESLTADRVASAGRVERAVEEGKTLARGLAEAQRRGDDLAELLRQRDAAADIAGGEREQLAGQVAALTGQLHAAQEGAQRVQTRDAQERTALEADRDGWKEQAWTARKELAQSTDRVIVLEGELRGVVVGRDTTTAELQAAQAEIDRLALLDDELGHRIDQLEAAHAAASAENTGLRQLLDEERGARGSTEQTLQRTVTSLQAEAQRQAADAAALRAEAAEHAQALVARDQQLAELHTEIELLRQQSVDRGVLAHQTTELGAKVVELEQQLVAARSDGTRAERQRAALTEKLEAGRRREAEALAVTTREHAALQAALQAMTAERDRAQAYRAAQRGEGDAQQLTITQLQASLERLRGERTRVQEEQHETTRRLSATQRQLDEATATLQQREAALAATGGERQRLSVQLDAAQREIDSSRQELDAAEARVTQERAAFEHERDGWQEQLAAAQAETERLTGSLAELSHTTADLDAARTAARAERAALLEGLETERAAAHLLADERDLLRAEIDRLTADAATLRTVTAGRDEQLAAVHERAAAVEHEAATLQQSVAALQAERSTLAAQLEEQTAQTQQLRDGQAALERQLALVVATHGEEEQALANGMQAAREQVAQIEEERNGLRATLAELRQQLHTAQSAQAATLAEAHAAAAELRKQNKSLAAARTDATKRLERAEKALAAQAERADGEQRRAQAVGEQQLLLQQELAAARSARTTFEADLVQARGDIDRLSAQLQDAAAEFARVRAEHHDGERQLAQLSTAAGDRERVLAQQLDATRASATRLEDERAALQSACAALEQRLDQAAAAQKAVVADAHRDGDALREQLAALQTARDTLGEQLTDAQQTVAAQTAQVDAENRRAATLAEHNLQLQQALGAADQKQVAFDGVLAQARAEIEALRQQSEDRGVLAHEASELGARLVALEQQLAGVRGEAAQAERQRAALAEELDVVRRQQSEVEAAASREQSTLRAAVERFTAERQQAEAERRHLETEHAARLADVESQRGTIAELQAAMARADEAGQAATQRVADMQRQAETLGAQLGQRDAASESAAAERQRLAAQVATLSAQIRAGQDTIDSLQGRAALERAAIEAERESFAHQQTAADAEQQRLAALNDALTAQAAHLESDRSGGAAEIAALRRSTDDLRATHQQAAQAMRAEIAASQADTQRLSADLLALRGELAERDELLALLSAEEKAAREAEAERQQLIATLRGQLEAAGVRAEQATAECQQLRDAREAAERHAALIEAARGEEGQALTQGLQAASAQIAQLEQERNSARAALDDIRQQLAQAEGAAADTQARTQADLTALRQQVTTLTDARRTLTQRTEQVEQAFREQSAVADADGRRAQALNERCAELEQSLAAAESHRATLAADLQRMTAEVAGLRHDSADRGALARQTSALTGTISTLEQRLAELQGQATHAEQQRAAVAAELDAAQQEERRARAAAEQQQATLQTLIEQLTDERAQLVTARTAQQHQLDTQRLTLAELRAALEQAQADRQRADEDGRDTGQRLAEVHRKLDDLGDRLRQRDAAVEAATAERQRLEESLQAADGKLAELSAECETWRQQALSGGTGAADAAEADVDAEEFIVRMEHESATPPADTSLVIERSAPLDALLDAAPEAVEPPPAEPEPEAPAALRLSESQEMVLLDASGRGDEAFHVLKNAGFLVTRTQPNDAAVDELAARKISCVMLNLAAGPAAWRTLKMLRERAGTRAVPILAYLMGPDSQQGFCFGRTDFGIWPMDGQRLTDRLTHLRPNLKRLLAVSADIDGVGRLRDPLTKAGISTSSVLDGKQALEFASMVAPEAALFHLSPTCAGVARAITALRAGESMRDLPMVVLLDKAPPREDAFYAITARELISKGTFQFASLPGEIARLLA